MDVLAVGFWLALVAVVEIWASDHQLTSEHEIAARTSEVGHVRVFNASDAPTITRNAASARRVSVDVLAVEKKKDVSESPCNKPSYCKTLPPIVRPAILCSISQCLANLPKPLSR